MEKAMGLLLGAFFMFNICYPPGCPLTMEFLQRYFGQINPLKGRGKGPTSGFAPKLLSLLQMLLHWSIAADTDDSDASRKTPTTTTQAASSMLSFVIVHFIWRS
uniref:Putative secreted protein n=1 Tax=Ixodes ricinus TaxID=34613 RepID=A0A6B0UII2_IXORI